MPGRGENPRNTGISPVEQCTQYVNWERQFRGSRMSLRTACPTCSQDLRGTITRNPPGDLSPLPGSGPATSSGRRDRGDATLVRPGRLANVASVGRHGDRVEV